MKSRGNYDEVRKRALEMTISISQILKLTYHSPLRGPEHLSAVERCAERVQDELASIFKEFRELHEFELQKAQLAATKQHLESRIQGKLGNTIHVSFGKRLLAVDSEI